RGHTRLVSDWSSDVCSSDLLGERFDGLAPNHLLRLEPVDPLPKELDVSIRHLAVFALQQTGDRLQRGAFAGSVGSKQRDDLTLEIGRASCRERGEGSVGAGS